MLFFTWRRHAQGPSPLDLLADSLPVIGRQLHRRDSAVRADSNVVLSAHVQRMLQMLDDVGSGRVSLRSEERHEKDADNPPAIRERFQRVIGLVAWRISHRRASGMRD